mgnify:CR=1 FL=1
MTHDPKNDGNGHEAPLESLLEQLEVESAPASLTSRLYRIPEEESSKGWKWPWQWNFNPAPRWVMAPALAAVPLLVIGLVLMQPQQPSKADVEQARQDLAIAFAYLDKAGLRAGEEIQSVLGEDPRHRVQAPLSRHPPSTEHDRKEETS